VGILPHWARVTTRTRPSSVPMLSTESIARLHLARCDDQHHLVPELTYGVGGVDWRLVARCQTSSPRVHVTDCEPGRVAEGVHVVVVDGPRGSHPDRRGGGAGGGAGVARRWGWSRCRGGFLWKRQLWVTAVPTMRQRRPECDRMSPAGWRSVALPRDPSSTVHAVEEAPR
jgi:hypothetical protein